MLLPVKDMAGEQVGELEVDDAVFAGPVNNSLMHQALVRQLANARLGTHSTKTRGQVAGGGRKPWRQKGTGRARQGSIRSPNWVGGGIVFGPQPRKYTKAMPRKMRRAAICSALAVKADAGEIVVVDKLTMSTPQTRGMVDALDALGANGRSVLMVTAEKNANVQRSANNLPKVKTLLSSYINIRDLLGHDLVILCRDAVAQLEDWLGQAGVDETSNGVEPVVEEDADVDATQEVPVADEPTAEEAALDEETAGPSLDTAEEE